MLTCMITSDALHTVFACMHMQTHLSVTCTNMHVHNTVQVIKLRDDIAKLDEEAARIASEQAAESRAVKVRSLHIQILFFAHTKLFRGQFRRLFRVHYTYS
jgi:hypothetical protein